MILGKNVKSSLRREKLIFLSVGFMVVFVCGVGLNPVKAQEIPDTLVSKKYILYATDDVIFDADKVDEKPEFPGGIQKFYEFLRDNIQYPGGEMVISGTVLVEFVVEKDGNLTDFTILRSSGYPILDEEALRVVKLMPNWIPAKLNGKPVSTYFQIPVKFQLNDENKNNNTENEPLKGKKKKK